MPRPPRVEERIADALEALCVRLAHDANHQQQTNVILIRIKEILERIEVKLGAPSGSDQQTAIDAATAKLKANNDRTEAVLKH